MSLTDNQLIINAQQGDMSSFEELVYRYDRHVLNIAKSFRNNDDDAKDIYQEVFMRVYRGLKNFQFKSEFSTWLFRVTTNVCITHQSRKKDHDSLNKEIYSDEDSSITLADTLSDNKSTDELVVGGDISKYINRALDELPPQQKMVFTLKYFEEYKIREIAEMMQCTEGAVKKYLFTATHKMRDRLKNILWEKR
ncbi:MAG: RNA polymerase sigma factor [Melioribacter sp.]|nr:RNA polymerase sigma factor [Melioribacter sp.]